MTETQLVVSMEKNFYLSVYLLSDNISPHNYQGQYEHLEG